MFLPPTGEEVSITIDGNEVRATDYDWNHCMTHWGCGPEQLAQIALHRVYGRELPPLLVQLISNDACLRRDQMVDLEHEHVNFIIDNVPYSFAVSTLSPVIIN